nr:MAG TPA: hypothetical protein [Caudoviricetes sp.]
MSRLPKHTVFSMEKKYLMERKSRHLDNLNCYYYTLIFI